MSSRRRLVLRILRLPAVLYDLGIGWVLGYRFLGLTHRGRRSGRCFTTVLEVVRWRPDLQEAVVVSGLGRSAQWYRNVLAGGAVEVRTGRLSFTPQLRRLDAEEAAAVLAEYEQRNRIVAPLVRAVLSRLAGFRYDGSLAARRRLVATLPLVAFRPSQEASARCSAGPANRKELVPMAEGDLVALERQGWAALSTHGEAARAFYEEVLDERAVMLLPGGMVLDGRAAIVESMATQPWSRYAMEDARCLRPAPDIAIVTYGVVAERDGLEYSALMSSLYVRRVDGWKLAFHQQTPR